MSGAPRFTISQIKQLQLTGNVAVDRPNVQGAMDFVMDTNNPPADRRWVVLHFFAAKLREAYKC